MQIFKLCSFFLILFSIGSCTNIANQKKVIKSDQEKCIVKDNPKLFLDLWGGMSEGDYNCVVSTLAKNNRLIYDEGSNKSYYYALTPDTLKVEPEFRKGKLLQVSLIFRSDSYLEQYLVQNGHLTMPSTIVREEAARKIETFLKEKYGTTPKYKSIKSDLKISGSRNRESLTWEEGNRLIVLNKELAPVFVTPVNSGNQRSKIKILKYLVTKMQIDYRNKGMNESEQSDINADKVKKQNESKLQYQNL